MSEEKNSGVGFFEVVLPIIIVVVALTLFITVIAMYGTKGVSDGDLETKGKTSIGAVSETVEKNRELPENVKTLISDGATRIDGNRLYLTPESVTEFLNSNNNLKSSKDKVFSSDKPVLTEIPLEPENTDSPTFWLYYAEGEGFYINAPELPGVDLGEKTAEESDSSTDSDNFKKRASISALSGSIIGMGLVVLMMALIPVFDRDN